LRAAGKALPPRGGGRRSAARRLGAALSIALAASAAAAGLWLSGGLSGLEGLTYDLRARSMARKAPSTGQVVLIALDQASLDWAADELMVYWPWPREFYGSVVDFCARAGAKAAAFDVVYTEPSNNVGDDEAFGAAISRYGRFISAVQLMRDGPGASSWPTAGRPSPVTLGGLLPFIQRYGADARRAVAVFNIDEVDAGAGALGNVIFEAEDGRESVYRGLAPILALGDTPVPALGLAAYLRGEGIASMEYRDGAIKVGGRSIPLDGRGEALLRYRGGTLTHKAYQAAAVIRSEWQAAAGEEPEIDPEELRGKYVVFGFVATGLKDIRSTPMGSMAGMEIHATFLDNLLEGDFNRRLGDPASLALAALLAALASLGIVLIKKPLGQALVYAVSLSLPVLTAFLFYTAGWWFLLMPSLLAVIMALAGAVIYNYATEGRQKAFIKGAFRQYLSPVVIEQLIAHPEKLNLGGERRQLSIFFSDVQGFTSLSEALSPEDLTAVLNDYLSAMTDIIQEEQGTVDKYEGDAIIAFWNAPLDLPDHGLRAVRAAIRCQEKLTEMRPAFKERTGKELYMRVGLNSGPAVVGNMGSKTRFDYTMLGDAVNLAARLEGVNKQFGTYTMISANTLAELPADSGFACRELSRIAVVGKKIPVTVYEPMRIAEYQARRATLEAFAAALALYYAGKFNEALEAFNAISDIDPPAARYAAQCERLIASPPAEWAGVWTMTEK